MRERAISDTEHDRGRKVAGERISAHALDLDNYIPAQLAYLTNRLTSSATAAYRPKFGVGLSDWRIIAMLGREPWIQAARICEATGMDKGAVSRSLRDLLQHGLVEARADRGNQRRQLLALTPKGLIVHDHLVRMSIERERRLLAGFSREEKRVMQSLLARMKGNVGLLAAALDESEERAERR
jgi:DNA-binding MarR family transcriptional regulator